MDKPAEGVRVSPTALRSTAEAVLAKLGTPADIAETVAAHLVEAQRAGYDSHGVVQLPGYASQVRAGTLDPAGRPRIVTERAAAARVDGHDGWGMYAAGFSMARAIQKAKAAGVGTVALGRCSHIGRLGHYVEMAAAAGMVGLVTFGDGQARDHLAAPYGSRTRALSTNPIAAGVPAHGPGRDFLADFATTTMANARTWAYRDRGEPLPAGVALNAAGEPTTDAQEYADGGTLVIFGGHKGSALSILTVLLAALNGTATQEQHPHLRGSTFVAIDVAAFVPVEDYRAATAAFLESLRGLEPQPGVSEVLMPGDVERRARALTDAEGLVISEPVRQSLVTLCDELEVDHDVFAG